MRTILLYTGYGFVALFIYTFIAMQLYPWAVKLMKKLDAGDEEGAGALYSGLWPFSITLTIVIAILAGPIYLCWMISPAKRAEDKRKRQEKLRREQERIQTAIARGKGPEQLQEIHRALFPPESSI